MTQIAIVGMSCLLPDYTTKDMLWEVLKTGKSLVKEEKFEEHVIERGRLLKSESDTFFKEVFDSKTLNKLSSLGEVAKWVNYVVQAALEDSGYLDKKEALNKTGLIMGTLGMFVPEYTTLFDPVVKLRIEEQMNLLLDEERFCYENNQLERQLCKDGFLVDDLVMTTAYEIFGLEGPHVCFSAACATPLYSIQLASMYLAMHKADMMIAGAQCVGETETQISGIFELLGVLSEKGESRPFDKNSKGLIPGTGAGALVLKRLEDAKRDGDHIIAVIEGIGWSNDGGSKSLLAPAKEGQIAAFNDIYKKGISPEIDYIECHATGTKAGDKVEIESVNTYFKAYGVTPLLGALKGNTGHCFTASAMGSTIKLLLAMMHDEIPATIGITNVASPNVVCHNQKWPNRNREKRGAVNAFGFGGINAHMVVSEYIPDKIYPVNEKKAQEAEDVVITGMGMQVGKLSSVSDFWRALIKEETALTQADAKRFYGLEQDPKVLQLLGIQELPKGAYIGDIDVDFMRFKLATKEDVYYLRRDLLLLNVAAQALEKAHIQPGSLPETAVIINTPQDFSDFNYRLSTEMAPAILNSLEKTCPNLNEKQKARLMEILREDEMSRESGASIVGGIPSIRGSRISSYWRFTGPSFVLVENENAIGRSLEIAKFMLEEKMVKCVVIGTVELAGEIEYLFAQRQMGNLETLCEVGVGEGAAILVLKSKEQAECDQDTVYATLKEVTIASSHQAVALQNDEAESGASDVEAIIGRTGSLEGFVNLIKDAYELYSGINLENKQQSNNWFWKQEERAHQVYLEQRTHMGETVHIGLEENTTCKSQLLKPKAPSYFFPIGFRNKEELMTQLECLKVAKSNQVGRLSENFINDFSKQSPYILCILAKDEQILKEEINEVTKHIDDFFTADYEWQSVHGSYFTSRPLGEEAKIVYMSPPGGMFNAKAYYELLTLFPDLTQHIDYTYFNPEEMAMYQDQEKVIENYCFEIHTSHLLMRLLQEKLSLMPQQMIGASMGEMCSLLASGSIAIGEEEKESGKRFIKNVTQIIEQSFTDKNLVRNYFGEAVEDWETWYIRGDAKVIRNLVSAEEKAFVTIIGSPKDVIISGEAKVCERILKAAHGVGSPISGAYYVHTPIMESYYGKIKDIIAAQGTCIRDDLDYTIYSTYAGKPLTCEKTQVAEHIANIITHQVDFQSIVQKSYADGGRIFIDLSTNGMCENWSKEVLKDVPEKLIFSMYSKKYTAEENLFRILAKLVAHHSTVDLKQYLSNFEFDVNMAASFKKNVKMGLPSYKDHLIFKKNARSIHYADTTMLQKATAHIKQVTEQQKKEEMAHSAIRGQEPYEAPTTNSINWIAQTMSNNLKAYKLYSENESLIFKNCVQDMHTQGRKSQCSPKGVSEKTCIWNRSQIVEMTNGSMAKVLGKRYEEVDRYPIRARMPSPPYLFISRVTKFEATFGEYKPCMAEIEYDVPEDCVYTRKDHSISHVVLSEASQIGIFLGGYIGIDIHSKGTLRFRIADTKTKYVKSMDVKVGDTIRLNFRIKSFIKNGETTLIACEYECYNNNELMMVTQAMGGYFTAQDLEGSKGIVSLPNKMQKKLSQKKLIPCIQNSQHSFNKEEMRAFYEGDFKKCFKSACAVNMKTPYGVKEQVRMIENVKEISFIGGKYGLGKVVATRHITPEFWPFKAHFKNDPVLPGTIMLEGINQLLLFFAAYSGFLGQRPSMQVGVVTDNLINIAFRGQVKPSNSQLTFELDIKDVIQKEGQITGLVVDGNVYWEDRHVIKEENVSITFES